MSEPVESAAPSAEGRAWAVVVVAAALAILLLGGAVEGFRPLPSGRASADTVLPELLEPVGDVPEPPRVFRWKPGGPDVAFSQVLLFDERYQRVWQSPPVTGGELAVDPAVVFAGISAGRLLSWSVREVQEGRPRATSAVIDFTFDTDAHGRGIGEFVPGDIPVGR